jgi:hypothetical protein
MTASILDALWLRHDSWWWLAYLLLTDSERSFSLVAMLPIIIGLIFGALVADIAVRFFHITPPSIDL